MILSDGEIVGLFSSCVVTYRDLESTVGPASIDLHLGSTLKRWPRGILRDPRTDQSDLWETQRTRGDGSWVIEPGFRYLATTEEGVLIPGDLVGRLEGRSSWGRDGLEIHRCAGFIDPGFCGRPTLELSVVGSSLVIWPGARICQLVLMRLGEPVLKPYAGKYQGNTLPTPSLLHADQDVTEVTEVTHGA